MSDADAAGRHDAEPLASLVSQLRRERDGLREAMRTRALIEQAKGVLMARHRIDADAAFDRLSRTSQERNVRLAELAAAVVAQVSPPPGSAARPQPRPARGSAGRAVPVRVGEPGRLASPTLAPPATEDLPRVGHLLLASRLAAAPDRDAIVAALAEPATAWPPPASVVLTRCEPDGALRVVAAVGLSPEMASQWARIPPQVEVPLTTSARTGEPVWLADREQVDDAYPLMSRLAHVAAGVTLPVTYRGRMLGVLGLAWRDALDLDDALRAYLTAAADLVGQAWARIASGGAPEPTPDDVADEPWIQSLLDGALTPAALLAPRSEGGTVTDFIVVRANPAAVSDAQRQGVRLVGATLLTVVPEAGPRTLLPLCRAVLADGRSRQLDDVYLSGLTEDASGHYTVRVVRLGDRLQVTWRAWSAAELTHEDLVAAGRAVGVAAFRWRLGTRELRGTANLRQLLDWPSGRALAPDTVGEVVDPGGWLEVRRAVVHTLRTGAPLRRTIRLRTGNRWLQVVAERLADEAGRPVALRGHLRDVSRLPVVRIPPPMSGQRRELSDPPGAGWPI
ncbi:ANTAR domain-containing protein [Plantactinospora sp. GCM10030261]|uniref:GAF and ANTAR domain-containing protein n=1 Tax=Plantactinospora sp. GCM10030261 TaxID=3273420 RepID=UPI0036237B98